MDKGESTRGGKAMTNDPLPLPDIVGKTVASIESIQHGYEHDAYRITFTDGKVYDIVASYSDSWVHWEEQCTA